MMNHRRSYFVAGISMLIVIWGAVSSCGRRETVSIHRVETGVSEPAVACTALINITDVHKADSMTLEHPSIRRESHIATAKTLRVVSGDCSQKILLSPLQIFHDPYSLQLAPGRYLLLLDRANQWIGVKVP